MLYRLINFWIRRSSDSYLNYLRKKGLKIGNGTIAFDPRNIDIDFSRPSLVDIGENVFLHRHTTILTHDWASWCFVRLYNDFIPSHRKVRIGNNVWFGESCTILKGVTIGDNCIIGYGSVITKDIPSNSVAVGHPAKVISSIDDYYQRRKKEYFNEVTEYAYCIKDQLHKDPVLQDFYDDYPIFIDKTNIKSYKSIPFHHVFSDEQLNHWLEKHKAQYKGFDDFMNNLNLG